MIKAFLDHEDEFLEFKKVKNKLSTRTDLHAFLLLDSLLPGSKDDIVACGEHDQIWLGVDMDKLAKVITEDQVVELRRCGIFMDEDTDSLSMFV